MFLEVRFCFGDGGGGCGRSFRYSNMGLDIYLVITSMGWMVNVRVLVIGEQQT